MLLTKPELVLHYEHSFMMKLKPVLSMEVLLLIEVRLVCRQKIFLFVHIVKQLIQFHIHIYLVKPSSDFAYKTNFLHKVKLMVLNELNDLIIAIQA